MPIIFTLNTTESPNSFAQRLRNACKINTETFPSFRTQIPALLSLLMKMIIITVFSPPSWSPGVRSIRSGLLSSCVSPTWESRTRGIFVTWSAGHEWSTTPFGFCLSWRRRSEGENA